MLAASFVPPYSIKANALSTRQEYFLEFAVSYSRADMYENKICGALTAAQAIFECGWGTSGLARNARNLFGMRASYTWDGMVYDQYNSRDGILYKSYNDMIAVIDDDRDASTWRGYADWTDSVRDHSNLFNTADRYIPIRGEYDIEKVCHLVVECGYSGDEGYAEALIRCINGYGLETANDISENEYGVAAMAMNDAYAAVKPNSEFDLTYRVLGESPKYVPSDVKWESLDESVATVDSNGHVKVVGKSGSSGMIRVSIGNKSTCCLLDVMNLSEYDGFTTGIVNMRAEPSVESQRLGYLEANTGVLIHARTDEWINCTAVLSGGKKATGWVSSDYITLSNDLNKIRLIGFTRNYQNVKKGSTCKLKYAFGPCEAENQNITWTSSDENVLKVSGDGTVTALNYGTATVTATADGGASASCTVEVTDKVCSYNARTTSALYVRRLPAADAPYYGIVNADVNCIVIGEENNGWYQITAPLRNGTTVTGWALAPYIRVGGIADDAQNPNCPYDIASSLIEVKDGLAYGIQPQTTPLQLNMLSTGGNIDVTLDGVALDKDDFISTGCVISQTVGEEVISNTVIIKGDVFSDGRINALDYYVVKRSMQGTYTLSDLQRKAADINRNGTPDMSDYVLISRHCIGIYDIPQKMPQ